MTDYSKIRPNKSGRWWVKLRSTTLDNKGERYEYTDIYNVYEILGEIKICAEQHASYEPSSFYNFSIEDWEKMEVTENGYTIEACAPLLEKPPWE